MDTKWKKSKKIISFIIFFLGICLTLEGITGVLQNKPHGVRIHHLEKMLEDDYQQSANFRSFISERLDSFLVMATGGDGLGGIWGYDNGTYYGGEYYGRYYYGDYNEETFAELARDTDLLTDSAAGNIDGGLSPDMLQGYLDGLRGLQNAYYDVLTALREAEELTSEELDFYEGNLQSFQDALDDYQDALDDYYSSYQQNIKPLTEEQKQKLAQKYHDIIKGDLNLLYSVLYDGKVIYSNSDLLKADGNMAAPEGYNFLLYFDGEKVRIVKDGKELDVYGDGFYRDDSLWYVPGYRNFQTDESLKKVKICMAAARDPVLYTEGTYKKGGSRQLESPLYWMCHNLKSRRNILFMKLVCLGFGIVLLLLSFLCRKSRRQASEAIARVQAKIWVECKVLLLIAGIYLLYLIPTVYSSSLGYNLWQELSLAYDYNYAAAVADWGLPLLEAIPSLFWICLVWIIYLLCNDLRHNKGFWRHSLIAGLCAAFSAKGLSLPLPRKMALRNTVAFAGALLLGISALAAVMVISSSRHGQVGILLLFLPVFIGFLTAEYLVGRKNMETARDMEALSLRIGEIRDGNYDRCDSGTQLSGHDLKKAMEQLEDIRHGMASAVDEQMRSQHMKVELIANVSHDIKTPLTSIISYVEFLKQERELPEHVKDYVRILDEKSQRLKNMVQDVFAVSKAASGELPVHMEALDFGKLLLQTMADMQEQIDASAVTFRTELPETPMMIMADGQRMYRVFQNLFQNAIQYSLNGSRVYVTLQAQGAAAVASVKNTSCMEPEKGKDFTERFTRGDQSRTDGGSGLGLSIAQSFTEACGGKFALEIDADRFIVIISFPIRS